MKFLCENVVAPLWFTYICEKGRTLGKPYNVKVWCYWNHPWEHIANLTNIIWNVMGTWKNEKLYAHSPPSQGKKMSLPKSPFSYQHFWPKPPSQKHALNKLVCWCEEKMSWTMKLLDLVVWIWFLTYQLKNICGIGSSRWKAKNVLGNFKIRGTMCNDSTSFILFNVHSPTFLPL